MVSALREMPMTMLTRGERLQIMLTRKELEALDTWRFAARMPSRAAAIRELLKRGLSAEGFTLADSEMKSGDFGVGAREPARLRDGK
jgi:hypothetical protein